MNGIFQRIARFVEENELLKEGDNVLAAVSGGPDSVFLFSFLIYYSHKENISLKSAYIHHHLRKQADEEFVFVKKLAKKHKIPFYYRNITIEGKSSIEEVARIKRYGALAEIAKKANCNKIATGHNLDDQAETVIMRVLRGSGLGGLCGIPLISYAGKGSSKITIIRPLLAVKRKEIESYLKKKAILYKIDRSNFSMRFLRNRIRHQILPFLEKVNPNLKEQLTRMSFLLRDDFSFLKEQSEDICKKICTGKKDEILLKREKFEKLPVSLQRMVLSRIVEQLLCSPYRSYRVIEEIRIWIAKKKKGKLPVSGLKLYLVSDSENVKFSGNKPEKISGFSFRLKLFQKKYFPSIGIEIESEIVPFSKKMLRNPDNFIAYLDYGKIQPFLSSLTIRNWRKGDYFQPLGMKEKKRLSRFFINEKVSKNERGRNPLLVCGNEIVWVMGIQISEKYKVGQGKKVLRVKTRLPPLLTIRRGRLNRHRRTRNDTMGGKKVLRVKTRLPRPPQADSQW